MAAEVLGFMLGKMAWRHKLTHGDHRTRSSLAFHLSSCSEEAACLWSDGVRELSSKFAVIQHESGMSLSEKHQSMKRELCLAVE